MTTPQRTTAAEAARELIETLRGTKIKDDSGWYPIRVSELTEFLTAFEERVRGEAIDALRDSLTATERMVLMLEDSLAGVTNNDGVKWERAVMDVELTPDGSFRLSDARKAVHRAREAIRALSPTTDGMKT